MFQQWGTCSQLRTKQRWVGGEGEAYKEVR